MKFFLPTTKEGVAALGLNSMINLSCVTSKITRPVALIRLADWLHCEVSSLKVYAKETGLPEHLVKPALHFCHKHQLKVPSYQLAPTKAVLSMYDII